MLGGSLGQHLASCLHRRFRHGLACNHRRKSTCTGASQRTDRQALTGISQQVQSRKLLHLGTNNALTGAERQVVACQRVLYMLLGLVQGSSAGGRLLLHRLSPALKPWRCSHGFSQLVLQKQTDIARQQTEDTPPLRPQAEIPVKVALYSRLQRRLQPLHALAQGLHFPRLPQSLQGLLACLLQRTQPIELLAYALALGQALQSQRTFMATSQPIQGGRALHQNAQHQHSNQCQQGRGFFSCSWHCCLLQDE